MHDMYRKLFSALALAFTLPVILTSCIMYHPQTADIPLIEKKGDLRVEASAWASVLVVPDGVGGSATVSYGLTDWMAGQLHASVQDAKNFNLQVAAGTYAPIERTVLESYAGLNYGKSYKDIGSTRKYEQEIASGPATTYYIQVNYGWTHLCNSHMDVGFGLKAGAFQPRYTCVGYGGEAPEKGQLLYEMTQVQTLVEPRVFLRVGGESVKLQLGLSYCMFSGSGFSDNATFQYDPLSVSLGLSYRF